MHCHCHWHCWERGPYNWSRVATFGRRRGELPAELGVFFREPLQLGGVITSVITSVFDAIFYIIVIILLNAFGIDVVFERRIE